MSNAIELSTFKLKKTTSVPEFLLISEKFQREFLSIQRGYISRKLIYNDKEWADLVLWETMEDAKNAMAVCQESAVVLEYFTYFDLKSSKFTHFYVKEEY